MNGGSLFMWRDFFGSSARIIGVDFNPAAKKWVDSGFEIYIGNQADQNFWKDFFAEVGCIDVLLDDGGHTNSQQIITVHSAVPHIRDGGIIVVEDVHTSFMEYFGNPSRYSFINYAKRIIDRVNGRFPEISNLYNNYSNSIYAVHFYESIVCFSIDARKCQMSEPTTNNGLTSHAEDFRHADSGITIWLIKTQKIISGMLGGLNIGPIKRAGSKIFKFFHRLTTGIKDLKNVKYF